MAELETNKGLNDCEQGRGTRGKTELDVKIVVVWWWYDGGVMVSVNQRGTNLEMNQWGWRFEDELGDSLEMNQWGAGGPRMKMKMTTSR